MKFSPRDRVLQFSRDWFRSREHELFLWGLPSIVIIGLLACLIGYAQSLRPTKLGAAYLSEARRAAALEDYARADLFYKKSIVEQPNVGETLYEAAGLADRMGDTTRRDALIHRLVEEFDDPFALLARALVGLRKRVDDEESVIATEDLLDRAVVQAASLTGEYAQSFTKGVDSIRRGLARAKAALSKPAEAIAQLEKITTLELSDTLDLATLSLKTGDRARAAELATSVLESQQLPENGCLPCLYRAQAAAVLGKPQQAMQELARARRASATPKQTESVTAAALRCFHTSVSAAPETPPLALLESILPQAPFDPVLASTVAQLAGFGSHEEILPLTEEQLEAALISLEAPCTAHLLLGLRALRQSTDESDFHFDFARKQQANSSLTLSRIGLALVQEDQALLPLALTVNENAMRLAEEHPLTLEIQGHILLTVGRWQDAIDFLTPRATPEHPAIFTQLATAHEALGDHATAISYRKQAPPPQRR